MFGFYLIMDMVSNKIGNESEKPNSSIWMGLKTNYFYEFDTHI